MVTVNTTWAGSKVAPGVLAVVMLAWPGLVVHVAYLGRSGQENATAPIQPPRELMVRTVVPGALTEAVMLVLDAATVKVEGSLGADVVIAEVAVQ